MVWEGKNMKKQIDVGRNKLSGSVLRLKTSHALSLHETYINCPPEGR